MSEARTIVGGVGKDSVDATRPNDILLIGDSMLRKIQIQGQPNHIWKFCYPGATADELHRHILTEKLPGEASIGAVVINIGTNDLSRSRGRVRTISEVLEVLQLFLLRLSKMYPQAVICFIGILPRLDCDEQRAFDVNNKMCDFIAQRLSLSRRYCYRNFSSAFYDYEWPGPTRKPIKSYYRNTPEDTVHLSHSGTQVFQDCYNRFFNHLNKKLENRNVDLSMLMWQSEWERFNYWNLKTPSVRKSPYLERKRLTNFTSKQSEEISANEQVQKTNQ